MPMPSLELGAGQFAVHLETNRPVDLRRLAAFFDAIAREAQRKLGPRAELELTSLRTGSVTAIIGAYGTLIGGIAGVGAFVLSLAQYIESHRNRRVARRSAELVIDDSVVCFEFEANGFERIVVPSSNIAAVAAVLAGRKAVPATEGVRRRPSGGFGVSPFGTAPFGGPLGDTLSAQGAVGAHDPAGNLLGNRVAEGVGRASGASTAAAVGEAVYNQPLMPGTTGRAVIMRAGDLATPGLGKNMAMIGEFTPVAGSDQLVFESGDEVLEVVGAQGRDLPTGVPVTVTAAIQWDHPGTIVIVGWTHAGRNRG